MQFVSSTAVVMLSDFGCPVHGYCAKKIHSQGLGNSIENETITFLETEQFAIVVATDTLGSSYKIVGATRLGTILQTDLERRVRARAQGIVQYDCKRLQSFTEIFSTYFTKTFCTIHIAICVD